MWLATCNF